MIYLEMTMFKVRIKNRADIGYRENLKQSMRMAYIR